MHLSQAGCSDGLRVKLCKHFRRLLLKILQEQLLYLPKQPQKSCTPACKIYAPLIWQISPPGLRWSPQCINTWETKTSNTRSPVLKEQKTMQAQPHVVSACVCYIYICKNYFYDDHHTTLLLRPSLLRPLFPAFSLTLSSSILLLSLSCSLYFFLLPPLSHTLSLSLPPPPLFPVPSVSSFSPPPPPPPSFPVPAISSFSPLSLALTSSFVVFICVCSIARSGCYC